MFQIAGWNTLMTKLDNLISAAAGGVVRARTDSAITAGGVSAFLATTSNIGIYVGSGAPTVSAAKGSLYLRTDGSTTNDRAYINTDSGTTWTSLTTAS